MAQLAKLIREKYPDSYKDMNDEELEKAILAKYPDYKDLVQPEIIGDRSEVPLFTGEPMASLVPEKPKPEPKKSLSFKNHLANIAANAVALTDIMTKAKNIINPIIEPYLPAMIPQLAGEAEGPLNP